MSPSHTLATSPVPLRIQRWPLDVAAAIPPANASLLAGLRYGGTATQPWMAAVPTPALLGHPPLIDVWQTGVAPSAGQTGAVHWRCDGQWLFGQVDLLDADPAETLEALSFRVYTDIFECLRQTRCPRLLRLWNYLPRIHAEDSGLERYQQFNAGRQQAFLCAAQAAFDGAPAACALGLPHSRGHGLCVRFLAGLRAPVPIENPRQVSAFHYPTRYGPRAPTFSRAALADLGNQQIGLFVSGTASIVGHESVHEGDAQAQLAETLRNLRAVLDEAQRHTSARFTLEATEPVVYVRHAADAPLLRAQLAAALGEGSHFMQQAVFLQADICRADLLVEIETFGTAPGTL